MTNALCPQCGSPRRDEDVAGMCPGCLLKAALDPLPPPPPDLPQIGKHLLMEELGRGGMGVVYRALDSKTGREVALKVIRAGELASPTERQRFRDEIELAATLDHPHIVPIYEVGEQAGQPYYTMRLCQSTLSDQLPLYSDPHAAARLIAEVARAVHHAHVRGVLHRDLKPANILLDDQGPPYVSDFGAAKRMGELTRTEPGTQVGTLPYMAPEQVRGEPSVTTAADIYSLGIVLYELITGQLPFTGDTASIMEAIQKLEPAAPRAMVPRTPRDLEAICLRCLQKLPEARYPTADELAADLERFLRGEPIVARPVGAHVKVWRFALRHRLATAISAAAIAMLAVIAVTATVVAHAQEAELERDTLQTNAYAAHALAGALAFHLREQLDVLEKMAADPVVVQALHDADSALLEPWLARTQFTTLTVTSRTGTLIAHASPTGPVNVGRDYSWRDWFRGGRRLADAGIRTGYVSRAVRSEDDDRSKIALVVPLYDPDSQQYIGLLGGAIGTNFALGDKQLDGAGAAGPLAVIVVPRDRSRHTTVGEGDYIVIRHPGLAYGAEQEIHSSRLDELRAARTDRDQLRWRPPSTITDDAHQDPVPGFEGRWLAGFAPVGGTGLVVIVQTRHGTAVAPNARLLSRLTRAVSGVGLVGLMAICVVLWISARRRRASTRATALLPDLRAIELRSTIKMR